MAFANKIGSILRQAVSTNSSIYQAMRCMSSSRLFIGGLSYNTDDHGLRDAFSGYGEVVDAKVIHDRESGRSRGFGFITFASNEEASAAMTALDGKLPVILKSEASSFLLAARYTNHSSCSCRTELLLMLNTISFCALLSPANTCQRSCIVQPYIWNFKDVLSELILLQNVLFLVEVALVVVAAALAVVDMVAEVISSYSDGSD